MTESPDNSLAAVLLAESPASKLLLRIQRQIAAFERTWHRANTELRRARAEAETAPENSLDRSCELASFPQSARHELPDIPVAPTAAPAWPPVDEKTGRPLYFVG